MINDVTSLEELRQVVAVGQGFLYNDFGGTKPEYCLIHRVGCRHVDRMLKVKKGRLTYSKVWSDELTSLQTWLNQNARIFALCSACKPGVSDSSSPRLQLDPNHQWAFVSSAPGEPRVQLWTAWRMPFETDQSEEQRRLVALIAPHLRTLSCGPGQQLHGRFVHEDRNGRQPDAENVTFYNWRRGDGQCPFSGRSLSFERSYSPPPPAPVQNHLRFFTEWSVRAAGSDIGGWVATGPPPSSAGPLPGAREGQGGGVGGGGRMWSKPIDLRSSAALPRIGPPASAQTPNMDLPELRGFMAPLEEARPADHLAELSRLAADMDAGRVDLLVTIGVNPVYDAPVDLRFGERMAKVRLRVFMGLHEDETARLSQWVIPETHFLEAWSDTRAFDGTVSVVQPLIAPLYECHSPHELLAVLGGRIDGKAYDLVREFWQKQRGTGAFGPMTRPDGTADASFDALWRRTIHDGFLAGSAFPPKAVTLRPDAIGAAPPPPSAGTLEITFRPCPNVLDGRFANNGWLQELPRPVTKIAWDNVLSVSPNTAKRLGLLDQDLVTVRVGGGSVKLPVWRVPGQPDDSVMVHIGYGRTRAGRVGSGVGVDVAPLRPAAARWMATGVEIAANGERYQLACTQGHFAIENRFHVRADTLAHYEEAPDFAQHVVHTFGPEMTLYSNDEWKYEGHAWGMSIDLNACTGCNACVVACQAENNIPVVGKDQVARQREMHWIRIDRYYTGDENDPKETYFQPMACHHCETAPCEVVCPVAATVHSSEGLNDMVYNRCVGTRYCSHNCPYKVRRFNFLNWHKGIEETTKMVFNPDVTVRMRGVMEKCTYCVQRIQEKKIEAKAQGRRTLKDGEVKSACQQVCPAGAIAFGNINDPESRVAKLKAQQRDYELLEELNTRPRTTYLAKLRNPNPELA